MISRLLKARLKVFARETRANMTVEAAFLMPVLAISFVLMYVIFDAFRQHAVNQKAAYTLSDMLSRETAYITPTYMDNAQSTLEWLTSQHDQDVALRVTVVGYDAEDDEFDIKWSQVRGAVDVYSGSDLSNWHDKLPVMVDNEQVILVETWVAYQPPLNLGFLPREIRTRVFTRPRFAPQLKWSASAGA